jgi:inositol oxygenase
MQPMQPTRTHSLLAESRGLRNFAELERPGVRDFYALNHARQTVAFVESKHREYLPLRHREMGVWQTLEALAEIVDDSDPDLELSQIDHALQTAEALRADARPRWLILTGFIHDLGKILCLFEEPQWAVVGDTFPVGCAFSTEIVFPELFAANPDADTPEYASALGRYEAGCGLDQVLFSWGHDEYLYQVLRGHLSDEALAIIRFHSFYAGHREHAYDFLMNAGDQRLFEQVRDFNCYDLYSKTPESPNLASLRPYYEDLVAEFLPDRLQW